MRVHSLCLSVLFALAGCGVVHPGPPPPVPIKLGVISTLSGPNAYFDTLRNTKLAVEQINAAGGVLGRPLEVVPGDEAGIPSHGAEVAAKMVKSGVVAVIGPGYSDTAALAIPQSFKPTGIPCITDSAPASELSDLDDAGIFFRVMPSVTPEAHALATLLRRDGRRRVAVLYRGDADCTSFAHALEADLKREGRIVPTMVPFTDADEVDYPAIAAGLPDDVDAAVLVAQLGNMAPVINGWIASGEHETMPWYFTDFLVDPTAAKAVSDVKRMDGIQCVNPYPVGRDLAPYLEAFRTRFGEESPGWSLGVYDAAFMIALAMEEAGEATPKAVREHLVSVSRGGVHQVGTGSAGYADAVAKIRAGVDLDYDGINGDMDFTDAGELAHPTFVKAVWKDGVPANEDVAITD